MALHSDSWLDPVELEFSDMFLSLGWGASYSSLGQGNLRVQFCSLSDDEIKTQELAIVDASLVYEASSWPERGRPAATRSTFACSRMWELPGATFAVRTPKFRGSSTQLAPGLHIHGTVPAPLWTNSLRLFGASHPQRLCWVLFMPSSFGGPRHGLGVKSCT
ncbi:hypothetical protein CDEST_14959 [Colletotrichum destructivum]|uniref:Uncharacterized protein n=1 Tax=Colletotrichum destructivum TaxID=34406 RepID=A0AAX4J3M0_9PEZI|nr:hypothetical protein CDEST_14959 [Colletotrichum destructivum]